MKYWHQNSRKTRIDADLTYTLRRFNEQLRYYYESAKWDFLDPRKNLDLAKNLDPRKKYFEPRNPRNPPKNLARATKAPMDALFLLKFMFRTVAFSYR